MDNQLCRIAGCDFPLFAFSHCRNVVAAVSRAGGFGVLGAATFSPERLEEELRWIDDHVDGKPYGVDILFAERQAAESGARFADLNDAIPDGHIAFVSDLLAKHGVAFDRGAVVERGRVPAVTAERSLALLDISLRHPIRLMVNALGTAPRGMIEQSHAAGVLVGALVGAKHHAVRQAEAGVDLIVAQGTEAGGHCGEVSTLVLLPEVVRAVRAVRPVPVLAAGGIMTGAQMAGCMAMGAQGVWTGSVWLATSEAETSPVFREKMIEASSSDTRRSRTRTGKFSRQLRSGWHEAWGASHAPAPLAMPYQTVLSEPAFDRITRSAEAGNARARDLVSYFVGQGVGLVDSVRSAKGVVQDFRAEFADALTALLEVAG